MTWVPWVGAFLVVQALAAWNYVSFRHAYDNPSETTRIYHYLWASFLSLTLVSYLFFEWITVITSTEGLPALLQYRFVAPISLIAFFIILDRVVRKDSPDLEDTDTKSENETPSQTPDQTKNSTEEDIEQPDPADVSLPFKESDLPKITVAGVVGGLIATGIGRLFAPPVTIAIAIGAIAAAIGALAADYPRFAAAGGIYIFAAAGMFGHSAESLPAVYYEDAFSSMFLFALLALTLVAIQEAGQAVIKRLFGKNADAIIAVYRSITAAIAVVLTLLAGERLWRKAARYGGIGVGGPVFAGMDILGVDLPAPLFFADGVNAAVVGFVAVLTAAFFTLDSLYAAWHAAKYGASAAASGAKKGASAASQAASASKEYVDEQRSE